MKNVTSGINARNAHEKYHELKATFRNTYWELYQNKLKAYEENYGQDAPLSARSDIRHEISSGLKLFNYFECCSIENKNTFGYKPYLYENIFDRLRYALDDGAPETIDYLLRLLPDDIEKGKSYQDPDDRKDTSFGFWRLCNIQFLVNYLAQWQGLKEVLSNEIEDDLHGKVDSSPTPIPSNPISNNLLFNSGKFKKIDLIRLGVALDGMRFFKKKDGDYPTRKNVIDFLGEVFGFEMGDYTSNYSHSKDAPISEQVKLFNEMIAIIEKENKLD